MAGVESAPPVVVRFKGHVKKGALASGVEPCKSLHNLKQIEKRNEVRQNHHLMADPKLCAP